MKLIHVEVHPSNDDKAIGYSKIYINCIMPSCRLLTNLIHKTTLSKKIVVACSQEHADSIQFLREDNI